MNKNNIDSNDLTFRIGHGFDIHTFDSGRALVLGGVRIEHHSGLLGHSDGDALCHAIIDALLGSLSLGDIGNHFPDTDAKYKDANSAQLLQEIYGLVSAKGYRIGNIDATIITELPRLAPYMEKIRQKLASVLKISTEQLSIKAKSNEKMDSIGQEKSLAVHAIALLFREQQ